MPSMNAQARLAIVASAATILASAACTEDHADPQAFLSSGIDGPESTNNDRVTGGRLKTLENALRPWSSGHAMAVTEDHIHAIDQDNHALVVLDRGSGQIARTISTGARPDQVVVGPDGAAFVSVRGEGKVVRIEAGSNTVSAETIVGLEPTGLALSDDGRLLLVALWGEGSVVILNSATMDIVNTVETVPRPRAITVNRHHEVTVVGDHALRSSFNISNTDRHIRARAKALNGLHDTPETNVPVRPTLALSVITQPDTGRPLTAYQVVEPGNPEADIIVPYYNKVRASDVAVEHDMAAHQYDEPLSSSDSETSPPTKAQQPRPSTRFSGNLTIARDINHHPWLSMAVVVGMSSDSLILISTQRTPEILLNLPTGPAPVAACFAPDGRKLYVLNSHDLTVTEFDLDLDVKALITPPTLTERKEEGSPISISPERTFTIGRSPLSAQALLGRRLFTLNVAMHDENRGQGSQTSCQSCHYEGLDDAITRSGVEGLRQTPMLAGRLSETAPYAWAGSNKHLQGHVRATMERLGHLSPTTQSLDAIAEYLLNHLPEPISPRDVEGLSESALRGKAIFEDPAVGCATCHGGANTTDNLNHDVGTYSEVERRLDQERLDDAFIDKLPNGQFNTPSLKNLRYSAPYLHDGSAPTLEDVLDMTDGTMGHTGHLSQDERADLLNYLRTL